MFKAADGTYKEAEWVEGKAENHWQISGAKVRGSKDTDVYKKYKSKAFSNTKNVLGAIRGFKTMKGSAA